MDRIRPFLWYNTQAEEAANFYVSIFKNSKILHVARYPEGGPMPAGTAMVVVFELDGRGFLALNGGPNFKFTEAISFTISCENQQEIDYYWAKLTADGGSEGPCGWLKDKYGLSWQVVPKKMGELLSNPKTASRVMQEEMKMKKIDLAILERAARGE